MNSVGTHVTTIRHTEFRVGYAETWP